MTYFQRQGIEAQFDDREAAQIAAEYNQKGSARTTHIWIKALKAAGVENTTLLDVGGGTDVIKLDLLKAGARRAVSIEASTDYLKVAQQASVRQGLPDGIEFQQGDFVALGNGLPPADIITIDRSLCCYLDMPALVSLSADRATRL